jgi:hypothetical protein
MTATEPVALSRGCENRSQTKVDFFVLFWYSGLILLVGLLEWMEIKFGFDGSKK